MKTEIDAKVNAKLNTKDKTTEQITKRWANKTDGINNINY